MGAETSASPTRMVASTVMRNSTSSVPPRGHNAPRVQLKIMQLRPGQSPEKVEFLHKLELSCRAEIKLRLRAIEYQRGLEGS
jgi:hypothetical protein